MRALLTTVVLAACCAFAGCGSSGKRTDNCAAFSACGGNIVGTWNYVSGCATFMSATCPDEHTMTTPAPGAVATYTFGSDGTFTYTFSGGANETINYSLGCLSAFTDAGIPQACADVQSLYRMSVGQDAGSGSAQIASATCSAGQNQTCNCTLAFSSLPQQMQSGSYTISGNQVTITTPSANGGAPDPGTPTDYCVSGNKLTIHLVTDSGTSGVLTLTR
jgi:hypothetical protein